MYNVVIQTYTEYRIYNVDLFYIIMYVSPHKPIEHNHG